MKWVVQLVLPGSATLYFTLATIWKLPYAEQIVGTTAAVTTFLGIILGISSFYYDRNTENRVE